MADMFTLDARGLTCPQPVLETKKILEDESLHEFLVLVDNAGAKENICRFARSQGCDATAENNGGDHFAIHIARAGGPHAQNAEEPPVDCPIIEPAQHQNTVVYVATSRMGRGDDQLGAKLMRGFLRTWIDVSPPPWRMIFINSGVMLTTTDEEAIDALVVLAEKGVEILSCGTCLEHFGLEDKLAIGKITNMYEVIDSFNQAGKVISPD